MGFAIDVGYTSALDHAEGSADRNGATLDMANKEAVLMFVKFGDIAVGATTSIKAQQGAQSDLSDAADLAGTAITVAADDDNQTFCIAIEKPRERYVRVVVDKDASNNTEEMAWYITCGHRTLPALASVTDSFTLENHVSPAEGTA